MDCPKCNGTMKELTLDLLHGHVQIDQCTKCQGLWFDEGEVDAMKEDWMSEFVDRGDPKEGRRYNRVRDIDCPRCGKRMEQLNDPKQKHIEYEACAEHGIFMDAGEFTDYKYNTALDLFKGLLAKIKR